MENGSASGGRRKGELNPPPLHSTVFRLFSPLSLSFSILFSHLFNRIPGCNSGLSSHVIHLCLPPKGYLTEELGIGASIHLEKGGGGGEKRKKKDTASSMRECRQCNTKVCTKQRMATDITQLPVATQGAFITFPFSKKKALPAESAPTSL